jgi:hypothetical protein
VFEWCGEVENIAVCEENRRNIAVETVTLCFRIIYMHINDLKGAANNLFICIFMNCIILTIIIHICDYRKLAMYVFTNVDNNYRKELFSIETFILHINDLKGDGLEGRSVDALNLLHVHTF